MDYLVGNYKDRVDLSGKNFGTFVVIKYLGGPRSLWLIKCDCGQERSIRAQSIKENRGIRRCNQKCTAYIGTKSIKPQGDVGLTRLFNNNKKGAFRRGLEWGLTKEEFKKITSGDCVYCGVAPSNIASIMDYGKKSLSRFSDTYVEKSKYFYNGVDREDCSKGYILDNCVSCCKNCNFAKFKLSKADFLNHIEKIYKHSVEKNV